MLLSTSNQALAQGGDASATASAGGADSATGAGGNGASDLSSGSSSQYRGGGGGGAGVTGGNGGRGYNNSAPAAAGGGTAGASGANGADGLQPNSAPGGSNSGGGGGGGAHGFFGALPTGVTTGGNGGNGGLSAEGSGGGGGGAGGYGAVVTGNGTISAASTGGNGGNGGTGFAMGSGGSGGVGLLTTGSTALTIGSGVNVTGGNGGSTQDGSGIFGAGGSGGAGGAGVGAATGGLTLTNNGAIAGGMGRIGGNGGPGIANGPPGTGPRYSGTDGRGGVGISGANLTVINNGSITGGLGYVSRTQARANAITFTGGVNALTLTSSSAIIGRVDAFSNADTLGLGGSSNGSFDVGQVGAAGSATAQYRGFGTLEKSGSSTWTLSGTAGTALSYRVVNGILDLGGGQQSGSSLTLVGGTLQNGTLASAGTFELRNGTVSAALAGSGSVMKSTSGTVTLTGSNGFSGSVTIAAGVLETNTSSGLGDGSATNSVVFNGGTLRATGSIASPTTRGVQMVGAGTIDTNGNAVAIAGVVTGTGTLTKSGAGALTLSGANTTYDGAIAVTAGTLSVDHSTSLGSTVGGTSVSGGATLAVLGTIDIGAEALSLAGTGVGDVGALTNVSGSNSFAGPITLSGDAGISARDGTLTLSGSLDGDVAGRALTLGGIGNGVLSGSVGANVGSVTKTGAGIWDLTGSNSYAGSTTISAGTIRINSGASLGIGGASNTLVFNGGTLAATADVLSASSRYVSMAGSGTIDTGNYSVALGGSIGGAGSLTKLGSGTLAFNGVNTLTGSTTVSAGRLAVNGWSTAGAITVASGATLGGTGTVGQTTIQSGGTLGAGNSIGTLNVMGPLNFAAGSVLDVEVRDGGNIAGVHNDLVAVTGAATIASGASVSVRPTNGTDTGTTYADSTRYAILTTTGGLSGTFASVSDQFAFLDASLDYDIDSVYLTLRRNDLSFASVGETPNQKAAAAALSGFERTSDVFRAILNLSASAAPRAFELASADPQPGSQFAIQQSFSSFRQVLAPKGRGPSGTVLSLTDTGQKGAASQEAPSPVVTPLLSQAAWLNPLAGHGALDSDGNGPGAEWTAGGLAAGYERAVPPGDGSATVGLGAGYLVTDVSLPLRLASARAEGGHIGAYADWAAGPLQLSGRLDYGASHVTTQRDVVVGAIRQTPTAAYWLQNVGVEIQGSYGFALNEALSVGPVAGLDMQWSGHGGFAESGGGALNASAGPTSFFTATTQLGVGFSYALDGDEGSFALKGRALWLHDIGDTAATANIALAGGGGAFPVSSAAAGRDRLQLGAGLDWSPAGNATVSGSYAGRFFGGATQHTFTAGVTLRF